MSRMPGPGTGTAEIDIGSAFRACGRLDHVGRDRRPAGRLHGREYCRGQRHRIAAQSQQAGERFAEFRPKALQPGIAANILDVHPIFKAHLMLGMTIFLVFPFTRLVHIWSAPVWYLGRRGYQVVRSRDGSVRAPDRPMMPAE